jgi:hypothetical protein
MGGYIKMAIKKCKMVWSGLIRLRIKNTGGIL